MPSSGYGYIYHKKVSLVAGKPQMLIEHSLKNAGTRAIHTSVYDHNFLVLDKQPTDAGFTITLPFTIAANPPIEKDLAEIRKNQIVYLKTLDRGGPRLHLHRGLRQQLRMTTKFASRTTKVKAGMSITADRPLDKMALWSIRSVIAVEPFIDISAEPGSQLTWQYHYEYYTLPR